MKTVLIAVLLVLLASASAVISGADAPVLNRAQLATLEQTANQRLLRLWSDNSLSLVGESRAIYLPGFGLVLSAEINLVTPAGSLFADAPSEKDKADLRKRKAERLPVLHSAMRDVMVNLAASLPQLAANEQIAFSVILPRFNWESGIPKQITLQASKQDLLGPQRDKAVKVLEVN
jgi:hypothetical protein